MTTEQLRHRMSPILKALKERSLRGRTPVEGLRRTECAYHGWDTVHADAASWEPFAPGDAFGGLEAHHCFKGTVTLPEASAGKRVVCLVSTGASDIWNNNNPQFLAYVDGRLVCGLDVNHNEFDLAACAVPGESHELALYVYCNTPARDVFLRVETAERDDDVTGLYYDLRAPYEVCALLADDDTRAIGIMKHLNRALNLLDLRDLDSGAFAQSVRDAREYLRTEFYDGFCGRTDATEACVGHTHIDVAWLWSLAQTREKAIRSFASVDYLMERYPEYTFMSSQPQLYDFVKRDCPALYERIRARVAQGRWEPEGGMWLEADCNMSSGESLVRQFLHGKRFFRDAFGRENRILWLPDAFGFSGALPQIMKQCGADYFMTTKLAWNDTDMMPHDVTHWRGIDGSEVLAYFISTKDYVKKPDKDPNPSFNTTYNGILAPRQVMGCWQRFQDKTLTDDVLQCYGYGDGGGGPTAEMLELQRRLAYGIPGAPRTRQSTSLAFFEELERRLAGQDVPCWCGEFYFEYHRGVFTTMARNKRYNRLAEFKNADAELFSALNLACGTAHAYPAEALAHNWELTLLNQFHDILPGSSIEKVYEDSMEQYEQVLASDASLIGDAQNALAALVRADGDGVLVFNQLGFARDALVRVPVEAPVAGVLADGRPLPFRWADGELCFVAAELPAKGWRHYRFAGCASAPVPFAQVSEDGRRITTPFYEAELDACGAFTRLYDTAARREVLKPGARGNVFQMFEDRPDNYDAWNLEQHYSEHMWELDGPAELSVEENSAVRCCVLVKRAFSRSAMEQRIVFYPHTRRIDFITHVDWHEEHALLKAAFPVDVYATRARYDIQFGSIERDTHRNTSWDAARFEVCAHKWADLSEAGYGVALLNDCKYGCDIHDGVMRLSLLRAPTHPNPNADRGAHTFTYALLPHEGDYRTGGVVREGYALNCPAYARPLAAQDGPLPESYSFVSVDAPGVVVEAVKRAEDGNGIIVRLYEAWGMRTRAVLSVPGSTRAVTPCTAMEDACGEAAVPENGGIPFQIRPFEFKTFRIELA